jgi:hypothetical protein
MNPLSHATLATAPTREIQDAIKTRIAALSTAIPISYCSVKGRILTILPPRRVILRIFSFMRL